jgi:hypothetical protein
MLHTISIVKGSYNLCYNIREADVYKKMDICKECCEKIGAVRKLDEKKVEPEPTVQDRLYDIVADLVNELVDNAMQNR